MQTHRNAERGTRSAELRRAKFSLPAAAARRRVVVSAQQPALVVLSAKNEERLREQAGQLLSAIERRGLGDEDLADVAYTLQVGREAMEFRLGVLAGSMAELTSKLRSYLSGESGIEEVYLGEIKRDKETFSALVGRLAPP